MWTRRTRECPVVAAAQGTDLVSGKMFLQPDDGSLVRLQGVLAKSPSFWIKNVEIVRSYARIEGTVVPVSLESNAQVRFPSGPLTLRMTYVLFPYRRAPHRHVNTLALALLCRADPGPMTGAQEGARASSAGAGALK